MSIKIPNELKIKHFHLFEKMESARAKYVEILARFDAQYVALAEMSDDVESNKAIDKLVAEETAAGKPEAYQAYADAANAVIDNAGKILELKYPERWKEISFLFESNNRIIYRDRILAIMKKYLGGK